MTVSAAGQPVRHSRRRVALENLGFGYVTIAIAVIQGILLVPLYLKMMPVELYGAWLATGNVLAWLELADPGIGSVLQQRVAFVTGRGYAAAVGPTVGTGLVLSGAFALIPLAALPLASQIGSWVNLAPHLRDELTTAFVIGIVSASFSLGSQGLSSVNVGLQRIRATGGVLTIATVVGVALTVIGLFRGWGVLSIPLGSATRAGLSLVGNAYIISAWARVEGVRPRPSGVEARAILGAASFSSISRIGVTILSRADAFLCARFLSPEATVTLTLTGRAIDVMRMVTDRIGVAAMPAVANLAGETGISGARPGARIVTRWVAALTAVCFGVGIAWNAHFVRLWVGQNHFGGNSLSFLLGCYAAFATLLAALGQILFALGRIRAVAAVTIGEAIVRLGAVALWLPIAGIAGFPLAGLSAALLVSGVLAPRVLATSFGVQASAEYRTLLWDFALASGFAVAGLLVAVSVPPSFEPGWMGLSVATAITGASFVLVVLAIDSWVRNEALRRLSALGGALARLRLRR